jgi:hypothetical protein
LDRLGVNLKTGNWLGVRRAGPVDLAALSQRQQQFELFLEQGVVVGEIVAEEREALDEGAAPRHDLGPTMRQQVEGGELLVDADRIVRTQHGDRRRQANRFGFHRRGGEDGDRRRCGEIRTVVFAETVEIKAELVGERDFFEHVGNALGR